ncbi:folate-binding protein [Niveispirillum sp. SYP-B3756]|uniref:CAF17-like 4Fe-4S cluster assembly/insertion protein YgfZ n=1 Tax=Niveispirillum sp. SYP-B3756 TaxID=2662178 RepID=UPI001290EDA8|nr:folate-binding protein YgfZ [Niveispirillum sp. SYP-B3756]MQP65840.1 folate-binding protein [Niveispirillum sp. SYP-B3756]
MSSTAPLIALPARTVIAVGGDDRVAFLQGLVSNDVSKLAPGRAIWAALLTAQGKFLHEFFIIDAGDRLLLDCEAARKDDLLRRLKMFKLRSKVELTDLSAELAVFARLRQAGEGGAAGLAFADPRQAEMGSRLLLPIGIQATGDFADWDRARIALGLPDGSRDLLVEKSILLENGFDELQGVAWDKGCYVGQELTARTKYRGLVKKRLVPVAVTGPLPEPGSLIRRDGQEVGEIRSGRDGMALALLRLEAIREGGALSCGEASLAVRAPAWAAFATA